jgi:hypothetical protein
MLQAARLLKGAYDLPRACIGWWFGEASLGEPKGERVFFSDLVPMPARDKDPCRLDVVPGAFVAAAPPAPYVIRSFRDLDSHAGDLAQRTAINDSGTARDNSLRVEETQPRNRDLWWVGRIEASGPDAAQLQALASLLDAAARCVEQFGADKGVGYGVVREVRVSPALEGVRFDPKPLSECLDPLRAMNGVRGPVAVPRPGGATGQFAYLPFLVFPLEPVWIASVQRPKSHFTEGLDHVPGAALKGALAALLNRDAGLPFETEISPTHPGARSWPNVAKHFQSIRFLHAYPVGPVSAPGSDRSFPVPLSAFAAGKSTEQVSDIALVAPDAPWTEAWPPAFAPDCSGLQTFVANSGTSGEALDERRAVMDVTLRTAIDEKTLTAKDKHLFGYTQLSEIVARRNAAGSGKDPVVPQLERQGFASEVSFVVAPGDVEPLKKELASLLPRIRLGKTNAAAAVRQGGASPGPLQERLRLYGREPVVLTLMSDALLDIPTSGINGMTDLTALYDQFWREALKRVGYEHPTSTLINSVFARQGLRGGWAGRRGRASAYRCFYLTLAGSVFVTAVTAAECLTNHKLREALDQIERAGAPLLEQGLSWQNCPYVPENGYGEVAICHPWHLQRRYQP